MWQMFETLMADEAITDKHKSRLMMIFSEIDKRLVDGADEHLSMLDLSMRIASVLAGK
jgi:replication factor C subunit 2/4